MAQYKVPQDVEADDKLIGPFNFRQFIYLLVVAALIALAWALAQIFPLLAIFPVPPALFLLALALPLRKDQPMETYLAALIKFYTTPNKRFWNPGQRESTITITAPKVVEQVLTKNLSEEEAGRRLSFLANIVDTEGYSIKGDLSAAPSSSPIRGEILAEANNATDIFDTYESTKVGTSLENEASRHRAQLVAGMRAALKGQETASAPSSPSISHSFSSSVSSLNTSKTQASNNPSFEIPQTPSSEASQKIDYSDIIVNPAALAAPAQPSTPPAVNPGLISLTKSDDLTVATLAKQANKKSKSSDDGEVYISLH